MKKVLISQPMGSRSAEEVKKDREKLVWKLEMQGYQILDNIFTDPIPDIPNNQIYYLGKAISLMAEADVVVFKYGFLNSRGCRLEYNIVKEYNIPLLFEDMHGDLKTTWDPVTMSV